MTPEEFINKLSTDVYDTSEQVRADLMPIIQQEAEAFAEWIEENSRRVSKHKWRIRIPDGNWFKDVFKITSELYQEYLKEKEKP